MCLRTCSFGWCLAEGYRNRSVPPYGPQGLGKDVRLFFRLINLHLTLIFITVYFITGFYLCCKKLMFIIVFKKNIFLFYFCNQFLILIDSYQAMHVCSAGIQSCRPGGIIVYSTCTLSPVQNDGAVAATLEHIWYRTGIEVVVEDIRTSMNCFTSMFKFFDGCRYGNLVLPNLVSNFGPMYFCRLRRIS